VYKKDGHTISSNIIKGSVTGLRLWNGDALQSYASLLITDNRFDSNTVNAVTSAATSASRIFNNYGLTDFGVLGQIIGLADPNADRIMFWDDSAGSYAYLSVGTNLSITGTTLDASSGVTEAQAIAYAVAL
jgi:hypothetical protein